MFQKNVLSFFMLFYAWCSFSNELKLEWQSYISSPSLKEQLSDYAFFKGDYKLDLIRGPFYFDSRFLMEYGLDSSEISYFNIPEMYIYYKYDLKKPLYLVHSIQFSLGRQARRWSIGDEYWDLGLWNPLLRWNPLHPVDNGLIGSFFTFTANQWESNFFVGLHAPDQNVEIIEKEGRIYSRSRWFSPLPESVPSFNINRINYSVDRPHYSDTLVQQSFLFSLKTWSKTPEVFYWMKWSFADKPTNHLFHVLNRNDRLQVESEKGGELFINQKITIFSVRQRILSTEWGLDYKNLSLVFSLENAKMKPASVLPEEYEFVQDQDDFTYFSALLKYDYLKESFIRLALIQSWFKNVSSSQKVSPLTARVKILEGAGVDWQTKLFSHTNRPLFFNLKYQYSFLDKGAWLSAKTIYYMTPKIYTELTMDVLGAFDLSKTGSFLKKFRHNDYFSWSVAYDF